MPAGGHGVEGPERHVAGLLCVGSATTGAAEAQLHEGRPREFRVQARSRPTRDRSPRRGRRRRARPAHRHRCRSDSSRESGSARWRPRRPGRSALPSSASVRVAPASASSLMTSARRSSLRTAPTSASACSRTCPRSLTHASPSACTTRRNDGRPWRSTGGKYVPGVEGPPVGGAEDRHRPAPRAGQRLGGRHVDRVEVGPLLTVHLDRDEPPGQIGRRRRVLEALVRHHVAPVARGVPDGDEDGLVLVAGQVQGLVPPGEPLDGVVGVLAEIRARLVGQVVHGRDARAPPAGRRTRRHPCKARAMELELTGKTALITGGEPRHRPGHGRSLRPRRAPTS